MPSDVTINVLVAKVRQRSDQINSQTFDDVTELKPWIRASLAQLHEVFCQRYSDWYTKNAPLSLTAGQEAYSLPSDFKSLANVYALYNGGAYRMKLREFDYDDFGALSNPYTLSSSARPLSYRLISSRIFFQPMPTVDMYNAIELFYVPQHRGPLLDYTPVDELLPQGFDEWVVLDVLQKMSVKTRLQNMDDILKSKQQIEQRLIAATASRSDQAPRMRDSWRVQNSTYGLGAPSGPLFWATA